MKLFSTSVALQTAIILILALTFLNLILLLINIGAIELPEKWQRASGPGPTARREIAQLKVGKETKIAGYKIKFGNPRYEFDEDYLFDSFKVDVKLMNENREPSLMPIFNCDIVDGEAVVMDDSGVLLDGPHELLKGESYDYMVTVPIEIDYAQKSQSFSKNDENLFPNRRVSSCKYTPTGSYDPNISVEVVF